MGEWVGMTLLSRPRQLTGWTLGLPEGDGQGGVLEEAEGAQGPFHHLCVLSGSRRGLPSYTGRWREELAFLSCALSSTVADLRLPGIF